MSRITREDIQVGTPVVTVEIPYAEFLDRFGPRHSDHPRDWDAPGPVELWFFELPWGHKITLEFHLTIDQVNIYVESLEIDSILDYVGLSNHVFYVNTPMVELLRASYPVYTKDLSPSSLFGLDDNGNKVRMRTYESRRIADYYQMLYENRGHKQYYWVEQDGAAQSEAGKIP